MRHSALVKSVEMTAEVWLSEWAHRMAGPRIPPWLGARSIGAFMPKLWVPSDVEITELRVLLF